MAHDELDSACAAIRPKGIRQWTPGSRCLRSHPFPCFLSVGSPKKRQLCRSPFKPQLMQVTHAITGLEKLETNLQNEIKKSLKGQSVIVPKPDEKWRTHIDSSPTTHTYLFPCSSWTTWGISVSPL